MKVVVAIDRAGGAWKIPQSHLGASREIVMSADERLVLTIRTLGGDLPSAIEILPSALVADLKMRIFQTFGGDYMVYRQRLVHINVETGDHEVMSDARTLASYNVTCDSVSCVVADDPPCQGRFLFKSPAQGSNMPRFMAASPIADEVYVCDLQDRVSVLSSADASERRSWSEQIAKPQGIAVSALGAEVFVACGNAVRVFGADGLFRREFPSNLNFVTGIAVSPSTGNIFVVSRDHHAIVVFSPQGEEIRRWGKGGKGVAEFVYPQGVCVSRAGEGASLAVVLRALIVDSNMPLVLTVTHLPFTSRPS